MSIFKTILGTIGEVTGISDVADAAKKLLSSITGNPEVTAKLQQLELEQLKLELDDNKSLRDLLKAEVASEDKFVRRARPAMLWLVLTVLALNFGVMPIINATVVIFGQSPIVITYPDLPENVYWLFGSLFAVYTGARSWDKNSATKNRHSTKG